MQLPNQVLYLPCQVNINLPGAYFRLKESNYICIIISLLYFLNHPLVSSRKSQLQNAVLQMHTHPHTHPTFPRASMSLACEKHFTSTWPQQHYWRHQSQGMVPGTEMWWTGSHLSCSRLTTLLSIWLGLLYDLWGALWPQIVPFFFFIKFSLSVQLPDEMWGL